VVVDSSRKREGIPHCACLPKAKRQEGLSSMEDPKDVVLTRRFDNKLDTLEPSWWRALNTGVPLSLSVKHQLNLPPFTMRIRSVLSSFGHRRHLKTPTLPDCASQCHNLCPSLHTHHPGGHKMTDRGRYITLYDVRTVAHASREKNEAMECRAKPGTQCTTTRRSSRLVATD
jgi:hypothetical protein